MAGMLSISRMALGLITNGLKLVGVPLMHINKAMDIGTIIKREMATGTLTVIMEDIHSLFA